MRCELNSYHPTLWRTCRALANERRLLCLKAVLLHPSLTVGEAAAFVNIPENQASINLRALQARGLITSQRQSRWTHYLPIADPFVEHAALLLATMRKTLTRGCPSERAVVTLLKAFTHARRLVVLSYLQKHPGALVESLVSASHISQPAMWRHLTLLHANSIIVNKDGRWSLSPARTMPNLAKALLPAVTSASRVFTPHEK